MVLLELDTDGRHRLKAKDALLAQSYAQAFIHVLHLLAGLAVLTAAAVVFMLRRPQPAADAISPRIASGSASH